MITVGVDLAAQPPGTWLAKVVWGDTSAQLIQLEGKVTNERVAAVASGGDKLAIDCPLGWPLSFVEYVNIHTALKPPEYPTDSIETQDHLTYRLTDYRVRDVMGQFPLSVAANFLGRTALRCSGLQGQLADEGFEIDRAGIEGQVIEVYPAVSLFQWGIPWDRSKSDDQTQLLDAAVDALKALTWLSLGDHEDTLRRSKDAFDALICSLAARASALGLTTLPSDDYETHHARHEGWIHVPDKGSLTQLCDPDNP